MLLRSSSLQMGQLSSIEPFLTSLLFPRSAYCTTQPSVSFAVVSSRCSLRLKAHALLGIVTDHCVCRLRERDQTSFPHTNLYHPAASSVAWPGAWERAELIKTPRAQRARTDEAECGDLSCLCRGTISLIALNTESCVNYVTARPPRSIASVPSLRSSRSGGIESLLSAYLSD